MRRLLLPYAIGLAVIALVSGIFLVPKLFDDDDEPATSPTVITRDDAVLVKKGRDYEVVGTVKLSVRREFLGLAADGLPIVGKLVLADPRTGELTELPTPPGSEWPMRVTRRYAWISARIGKLLSNNPSMHRLDRRTGATRTMAFPDVPMRDRAYINTPQGPADDGRLYFRVAPRAAAAGPLWSVAWGHPEQPRRELPEVERYVVADGILAWTLDEALHIRDLASGEETEVSLPCDVDVLLSNGEELAVNLACGSYCEPDFAEDCDEIEHPYGLLLDAAGTTLAKFDMQTEDPMLELSDRYLTWYGYAYDLDTGRLLRLTNWIETSHAPAAGDGSHRTTLAWPVFGKDYREGRNYSDLHLVVARMLD